MFVGAARYPSRRGPRRGLRARRTRYERSMSQRPESIPPGTRGPGYQRAPDHRVAFLPSAKKVVVKAGDQIIAESTDVVILEEANYPPRYYLARKDVNAERIQRVEGKTTFCPFKGLASYFSVVGPDGSIADAAWSYEQPYREAEILRDRIAFDRDKVSEVV